MEPHISFFLIENDEQVQYPDHYIHLVDPSTKLQLCGDGLPTRTSSWPNGVDILERLRYLNRSIGNDFQVKEAALERFQMRLYREDQNSSAKSVTSYAAMSYRCRTLDPTATFQNHDYPIPRLLFKAVWSQVGAHEGLWFDTGCIDQHNVEEKMASIGMMDVIFKRARVVIVALWDICLNESEILMLQSYQQEFENACEEHIASEMRGFGFHPYDHDYVPTTLIANPALLGLYIKLLTSDWFQRAFCGQEFRVSRSIVFLIQCSVPIDTKRTQFFKFDASFLLQLMQIWPQVGESRASYMDPRLNAQNRAQLRLMVSTIQTILDRKALRNLLESNPESEWTTNPATSSAKGENFMNTIVEIFSLHAGGDPMINDLQLRSWDANKDKLVLTMNSVEHPLVYTGSGDQIHGLVPDQCIEKLVMVSVASCDAWSLVCRGRPLSLNDARTTWVQWPTEQTSALLQGVTKRLDPESNLTFGTDENADYIELGLQFLSFYDLPPEAWRIRYKNWTKFCDRYDIDFSRLGNHLVIKELLTSFMAQTPLWLASTMQHQVFDVNLACSEQQLSFLYDTTPVDQGNDSETSQDTIEALKMLMRFIIIINEMMQPDTRTRDANYFSWRPRMVKIENEVGLVMAPPNAAIRLAVPDAIKAVACQHLSRCWILEPIKSSSGESHKWGLLGKSFIYAPPGLATALEQRAHSSQRDRVFGLPSVASDG